jgi:hypothetical protein
VKKAIVPSALSTLILISVALEIPFHHGERWIGFFAPFGIASAYVLVTIAKLVLGPILSRAEAPDDW